MKRKRTTNVSRILEFMRCPKLYHHNIVAAKNKKTSERQVIGNATHKLAAGESETRTRELVDTQLPDAPEERKVAVMAEALELAEQAREMEDPDLDVTDEDREVQLQWYDPETDMTIYALPDELIMFEEDDRRRPGKKIEVMQITELKAKAEWFRGYHWKQLFMFGLIATLALDYRYAIKLVLKLLTPGLQETKWFSQQLRDKQLFDLRQTLRAMDHAWQTRTFQETPGAFCRDCPLLAQCEKGQEFLRQRAEQRMWDDVDNDDRGRERTGLPVLNSVPANSACA